MEVTSDIASSILPLSMTSPILLRNGTLLIHGQNDHISVRKEDLLIDNGLIAEIGKDMKAPSGTKVIDCTDKIISPGFVDTHHHVWQTLLKGRHANHQLLEYMYKGNFMSALHSPEDIFYGQLGGCLEMLDAGTTTVLDHAHCIESPEHTEAAVQATVTSSIRSIFAYSPSPIITSFTPLATLPDLIQPWTMPTYTSLAARVPVQSHGRVTLGFGFDGWYLPPDVLQSLFRTVAEAGTKTLTAHMTNTPIFPPGSVPLYLAQLGLLDGRWVLSHGNEASGEEKAAIREAGAWVSSTPDTEMQMGMGEVVCFAKGGEMQDRCGLGIDCHSNQSASIVGQMRLGLQAARCWGDYETIKKGKALNKVYKTVEEAFNLGTIQGSRALNMENEIGSIAVGKRADLALFDATSPGMVCAAQHDPVAAIVLHSSVADIDAVIVDGKLVKEGGKLLLTTVDEQSRSFVGKDKLAWPEVARELVRRREAYEQKITSVDWDDVRTKTLQMFGADPSCVV